MALFLLFIFLVSVQEEIRKSLKILKRGGVILYPSDTLWGIGCDATNASAVERIYTIKKRSISKSMLMLLDSPSKLSNYMENVPNIALRLIESPNNQPLTIIYPKAKNVAFNLIASDGTIGIRITREVFSRALCYYLQKPLVSTSANISGGFEPALFSGISKEVLQSVDFIVNYKRARTQLVKPSKIIRIEEGGSIKIIRE